MVHTRAVEAQALLTRLSQEKLASFSSSSFFIGMVALNPRMAQTRASSTDSLQLLSLTEGRKETDKALAFPELAMNQLQKRIVSRKSLQCQKLTQPSFDSLTRYSLSKQSCKKNFQSLSAQLCQNSFQEDSYQLYRDSLQSLTDQLCRMILQSFSEQLCSNTLESFSAYLCRNGFHSFSDQLCTKSLENSISQLQLDLVTSLSLQQLNQKSFQLTYAQLSFQKLSQKSFQLSRSSLDGLIRQLDLVPSLSLASELGSRSCSSQLQTLNSDNSSFEQRAFNCAALLGSTQLGHKQLQQSTRQSFQLTSVQLCQCMAQRGASNIASHNRALRTNLSRRSLCTRSSQQALTTSTSKSTTSSLPENFACNLFVQLLVQHHPCHQHLPQHQLLETGGWQEQWAFQNCLGTRAWQPSSQINLSSNSSFSNSFQKTYKRRSTRRRSLSCRSRT